MIQNKTARRLLYDWHSGIGSAFYAAASSGLLESFDDLLRECKTISDPEDHRKLKEWLDHRRKADTKVLINWRTYAALPWMKR